MKKAEFLLKMSFVALAAIVACPSAHSQGAEKIPGRKDVAVQTTVPVQRQVTTPATPSSTSRQSQGVVKATLNPQLASQKRGAVAQPASGNAGRNCTPKANVKPYSISRRDFNNLPKDRQQFVLDNAARYTIVD